jgi:hypothetical protein
VRRHACALLLVLAARPAAAQGNDVHYRSWRYSGEPSSARAAGLAGAMVAVADDASGLASNPASPASLEMTQLLGTLLSRRAGRGALGDALLARNGSGFVGLGGRLTSRWAVGAYFVEPQAARIELQGTQPDGLRDAGTLDGTLSEAGLGVAFRVSRRLHVGSRLALQRLRLDAEYRRLAGAQTLLRVQTAGDERRATASFGLLYQASPRLWLGLARLAGARFGLERRAESPAFGAVLDPGSADTVRSPSVIAAGLAYRPSPRLMLTGQADYVRYGELTAPLKGGGYSRALYDLTRWEGRLGAELSLPFESVSLQLRAGWSGRLEAGVLAASGTATAAPAAPAREVSLAQLTALREPESGAEDPPPARVALGASLVFISGLRLDTAFLLGGERRALLLGMALGF